jgi:hypothetical protein
MKEESQNLQPLPGGELLEKPPEGIIEGFYPSALSSDISDEYVVENAYSANGSPDN